MKIFLIIISLLGLYSCSEITIQNENKKVDKIIDAWSEKITSLPTGLDVVNSPSTVYATINSKDPEKRGQYQLRFTTTVTAIEQDMEIVEFGAYIWENNKWNFATIYDRPFNKW